MKIALFVLTVCVALSAAAQPAVVTVTNTPRTLFESVNATTDTLMIKGFSTIGSLTEQISYPVEIRAERLSNPATSNNTYAVSVRTSFGQDFRIDYIDYDELDAVIHGVQYISQANSTVTPLDNFETVIRCRCGLSIAKVGRGAKTTIAMTPGCTNCPRNEMAPYVLDTFGRTLTAAKAKIDLVVASGQ
jgi:hypothetical protein